MDTVTAALAEPYRRLLERLGPQGVIAAPQDIEPYLADWRGLFRGAAGLVVRPASTAEVADVVRIARETGAKLVPQGGNTGLVGGSISPPDSIIVSLSRMNRIRDVDAASYTITVEAGCVLAQVQAAAAAADRLFPLSLAAEGSCQIGGNLATNAGGTAVLRYGNARDLVLGLEVVTADGRVWDGLKRLRKNNTGYDLRQLFVGSEGTLGIITAAVLKLFPAPRERATAFVALPDAEAAIALLARARGETGDMVTGFELMNRLSVAMAVKHGGAVHPLPAAEAPEFLLIELTSPRAGTGLGPALEDCLAAAAEDGLVLDAVIAQSETQANAFWKVREEISDAQGPEGGSIKHDVSVPIGRVADFIARASAACAAAIPGIRVVAFGHVGDGNVHFNLSQPVDMDRAAYMARRPEINRVVHDIVADLDGSFSAEHGVGQLKLEDMARYKQTVELDLLAAVKRALDPTGLFNPGKVVGGPAAPE